MMQYPRGVEMPVLRPLCWMFGHVTAKLFLGGGGYSERLVCMRCGKDLADHHKGDFG